MADQTATTKAGTDGRWQVRFENLKSSEPTTLLVQGSNTLRVSDVLIGEVWLGSGQSNMAMSVSRAANAEQEIAAANAPRIRLFIEGSGASDEPQKMGQGQWQLCSPKTVGGFSATLFFFGRDLHQTLDCPVGLIASAVGGTPIESWIAAEAQQNTKELQPFVDAANQAETNRRKSLPAIRKRYEQQLAQWEQSARAAKAEGKPAPAKPRDPVAAAQRKGNLGGLFNGKIAPLIPFAIRGAVWYQGEANSAPGKAEFYEYQLPLLVTDCGSDGGMTFPLPGCSCRTSAGRE